VIEADLSPCGSVNMGTILKIVFQKIKNFPQLPTRRVIGYAGIKL
jgi:hypothetical protein